MLLSKHGWVTATLGERLQRMAGLRNILVHGYTAVDPSIVRDVVENHLGDVDEFVASVRARLSPDKA